MIKVTSNSLEFEEPAIKGGCCWAGCNAPGKFPAPKSTLRPNERYHFCLEHVRTYNNCWDFFYKMDREQIDSFQKEMHLNNRPTWKFGVNSDFYNDAEKLKRQIFNDFRSQSDASNRNRTSKNAHSLPTKIAAALKILNLPYPVTINEIKKRYKELAKQHHPDLPDGCEEQFKAINSAYCTLKNSSYF